MGGWNLSHLISKIEQQLSAFYDFPLSVKASDHLFGLEDLQSIKFSKKIESSIGAERAGVYLQNSSELDQFIGIYFSDEITSKIANNNSHTKLSLQSLDEYSVVVEEVSHFHMLVNCIHSKTTVSALELEYQGEIDKILLSAKEFENHHSATYIEALLRVVFDNAEIFAKNERYWLASKYAAKFWYSAIRSEPSLTKTMSSSKLKNVLRRNYHTRLIDKIDLEHNEVLSA